MSFQILLQEENDWVCRRRARLKYDKTCNYKKVYAIEKDTIREEVKNVLEGHSSSDKSADNWLLSTTDDEKVVTRLSSDHLERDHLKGIK